MEMERKYQEYKDINEQVLYLYNSKKIIVDVEDRHYLEERNYIKRFFQQVEIIRENKFIKKKQILRKSLNL